MNGLTFAALVVLLFVSFVACCPGAPDGRSVDDAGDTRKVIDDGG